MTFPTYEEWGEKVAEQVIDVYLINGRTIRKWIEILSNELTMLDKIRAEIRDLRYSGGLPMAEIFGYIKCLKIIDRYIEGEQK